MTARDRFRETMYYGSYDQVPCFGEGIRDDTLQAWYREGLATNRPFRNVFPVDPHIEIAPNLEPHPVYNRWPKTKKDLTAFERRLDPYDEKRLPENWTEQIRLLRKRDSVRLLRVHRGLFLSLGVMGWRRFSELMHMLGRQPNIVREMMRIQGEFCALLTERILRELEIDAALFSEPIGGNDRPLISPDMYDDIVLKSYAPILKTLYRHGVETIILRTYANARILIPKLLKRGFNCLWACEVNIAAMDYRALRKEFGKNLRLIGGIDLDALRHGREAIFRELNEKLPPLLEQGGYVPLADGRIRADIPFKNYVYYRKLLGELIRKH